MSLFDNNNMILGLVLLIVLVIFYFFINYRFDSKVDEKLQKHQKKLLKKINALYKHYNADMREQEFENRRISEQMRGREIDLEMNRRQPPADDDSEVDSVQNVGGMSGNGGGNFASFDDDDDE
jgi:hypothetical protein